MNLDAMYQQHYSGVIAGVDLNGIVHSDADYDVLDLEERTRVVPADQANLYSSRVPEGGDIDLTGYHRPVLDIDFDAVLLPSSTEGHFHLYLDKLLTWEEYAKLLTVLAEVGIIEEGYARASIARHGTYVRKPGVAKL